MRVYVGFEDGEPIGVWKDKKIGHESLAGLDLYWKSWNKENKIPHREYSMVAFDEVEV